jgi:tRNA dimethylallyltransferase
MIIVVTGPTGVGKTKLSIELAKKYHAIIVNADSMQVYKDLNIGTAKITEEEKENIPHYLFDIVNPEDMYTVYDYQKDVRNILDHNKDKNIIIVGGTGLYIKAALYDYKFTDETSFDEYENLSNEELLNLVKKKYPDLKVDIHNRKRLVRALNKKDDYDTSGNQLLYNAIFIGLTTNRDNLYDIINKRVDKMFASGLLEEVKRLYDQNIHSKAIYTGIGYKELYDYFDGKITLEETKDLIKKRSRHYAKRQYTWFNNKMNITWFETNYENFSKTVNAVINYIENIK